MEQHSVQPVLSLVKIAVFSSVKTIFVPNLQSDCVKGGRREHATSVVCTRGLRCQFLLVIFGSMLSDTLKSGTALFVKGLHYPAESFRIFILYSPDQAGFSSPTTVNTFSPLSLFKNLVQNLWFFKKLSGNDAPFMSGRNLHCEQNTRMIQQFDERETVS